jgi:hypothetical protein
MPHVIAPFHQAVSLSLGTAFKPIAAWDWVSVSVYPYAEDVSGSREATLRLLLLKTLLCEFQGSTVLGDSAYDVVGGAGGNVGFELEGHLHSRSNQSDQMRDHLLGDPARVTTDTRKVQRDRPVEPAQSWGDGSTGCPAGRPRGRRSGTTTAVAPSWAAWKWSGRLGLHLPPRHIGLHQQRGALSRERHQLSTARLVRFANQRILWKNLSYLAADSLHGSSQRRDRYASSNRSD